MAGAMAREVRLQPSHLFTLVCAPRMNFVDIRLNLTFGVRSELELLYDLFTVHYA